MAAPAKRLAVIRHKSQVRPISYGYDVVNYFCFYDFTFKFETAMAYLIARLV